MVVVGICCPHRGAVHSYFWRHQHHPFVEGDRTASNVFFVWECIRPLLKGESCHVIPDTVIYDPVLLCKYIHKYQITRILFTPSLAQTVMECSDVDLKVVLKSLKVIQLCGEVVTKALRQLIIEAVPHVQLLNLYSISECHDVASDDISAGTTGHEETNSRFMLCGTIMSNVDVHVLRLQDMSVCDVGEIGDVFVSGPTLAAKYLKQPEKTRERFVQWLNPLTGTNLRCYRTGDQGILHASGRLEIRGRNDAMVKIRGYSVVLDTVSHYTLQHPSISSCTSIAEGKEGT